MILVAFKGAVSALRQFLETENFFKMMKNAFHFTLKAFLSLKTFTFLFFLSVQVEKWLY